jgi:isopenicillin N synthase-like dioxygenase
MNLDTLPVLSLAAEPAALSRDLGASFQQFGFAMVKDHGLDPALVERAWAQTQAFFALPDAQKRAYAIPGIGGARGYTPFRTEIAKGAKVSDLKEFWHVGRDLPADHPLAGAMPPNVWPAEIDGFHETFATLYAAFDQVGARILRASRCGWGWTSTGSTARSPMAIPCCACCTIRPCPARPTAPSAPARMKTST